MKGVRSNLAIGYCRVSTAMQVEDGVSLQAQRAKIGAWAELNNFELIDIWEDAGISGKSASNREGLQQAIREACARQAALVVYSLSRLARSTKDAISISEELDSSGADLVSVTESIDTTSAAGRMVFKLLSVLAEFERDTISERTRLAMAHMRSQNQRVSHRIPFGYDLEADGKTLRMNAEEQSAIQNMQKLKSKGLSLRKICRELEKQGVENKSGRVHWAAATVSGILKRNGS